MYQNRNIYQIPAVSSTLDPSLLNDTWLYLHNKARKNINVGPVAWNDDLAYEAQNYANKCIFHHAEIVEKSYEGENISLGKPSNEYNNINKIFTGWMSERNNCPSTDPYKIGHYTQ